MSDEVQTLSQLPPSKYGNESPLKSLKQRSSDAHKGQRGGSIDMSPSPWTGDGQSGPPSVQDTSLEHPPATVGENQKKVARRSDGRDHSPAPKPAVGTDPMTIDERVAAGISTNCEIQCELFSSFDADSLAKLRNQVQELTEELAEEKSKSSLFIKNELNRAVVKAGNQQDRLLASMRILIREGDSTNEGVDETVGSQGTPLADWSEPSTPLPKEATVLGSRPGSGARSGSSRVNVESMRKSFVEEMEPQWRQRTAQAIMETTKPLLEDLSKSRNQAGQMAEELSKLRSAHAQLRRDVVELCHVTKNDISAMLNERISSLRPKFYRSSILAVQKQVGLLRQDLTLLKESVGQMSMQHQIEIKEVADSFLKDPSARERNMIHTLHDRISGLIGAAGGLGYLEKMDPQTEEATLGSPSWRHADSLMTCVPLASKALVTVTEAVKGLRCSNDLSISAATKSTLRREALEGQKDLLGNELDLLVSGVKQVALTHLGRHYQDGKGTLGGKDGGDHSLETPAAATFTRTGGVEKGGKKNEGLSSMVIMVRDLRKWLIGVVSSIPEAARMNIESKQHDVHHRMGSAGANRASPSTAELHLSEAKAQAARNLAEATLWKRKCVKAWFRMSLLHFRCRRLIRAFVVTMKSRLRLSMSEAETWRNQLVELKEKAGFMIADPGSPTKKSSIGANPSSVVVLSSTIGAALGGDPLEKDGLARVDLSQVPPLESLRGPGRYPQSPSMYGAGGGTLADINAKRESRSMFSMYVAELVRTDNEEQQQQQHSSPRQSQARNPPTSSRINIDDGQVKRATNRRNPLVYRPLPPTSGMHQAKGTLRHKIGGGGGSIFSTTPKKDVLRAFLSQCPKDE